MDIFKKCMDYTRAEDAINSGNFPYFIPISGNDGPVVKMDNRQILMIGSNNYLGLTQDPRVIEAAISATKKYGTSCSGSRFLNGTLDLHNELEERIAKMMNRESALVFSTGYQTNLGAIATLAHKDDVLIIDRSDHSSIYTGTRASYGATVKRYRHNDMDDLERVISQVDPKKGKMIISDGVFSMEGDLVCLDRLVAIAKKYNARVYIDEAHGVGVLGNHGRGSCEHFDLEDDVDIIMSTFSKSLASLGGFVCGPEVVISYLKHTASPLIFSASPTPAATAAALAALDIIEKEPERRIRLAEIGDKMRRELKSLGFDTGESEITPIVPIYIRDDAKTFYFWRKLFDAGVFANAVVSPAVAPDQALIRTSFMSTHTDKHLDQCLDIMHKIGKEISII
ncbi:MAG: aminotransferase class I/II-fold pyridoxal phosphate-dependent enzyme [Calditrichaeota bacterium]|nr:MAG: aminotransferase class I/II-fold pyridoxal phosphate-dependent enzyme [Calditrichota bacterium]MBL1206746.1 aminotransferase class I/II-fold pyridoxal phosphate-dependent enzyme [Calditrichota bacterium]